MHHLPYFHNSIHNMIRLLVWLHDDCLLHLIWVTLYILIILSLFTFLLLYALYYIIFTFTLVVLHFVFTVIPSFFLFCLSLNLFLSFLHLLSSVDWRLYTYHLVLHVGCLHLFPPAAARASPLYFFIFHFWNLFKLTRHS